MAGNSYSKVIVGVLIAAVLFLSLLPVIADLVAGVGGNVTGAALVIVGLITLIVALGFIMWIVKASKLG